MYYCLAKKRGIGHWIPSIENAIEPGKCIEVITKHLLFITMNLKYRIASHVVSAPQAACRHALVVGPIRLLCD